MLQEIDKLKQILQNPCHFISNYFKCLRDRTNSAYNLRKQIERTKSGKDTLTKECTQVIEKINQIEAECKQTFQNNKFDTELIDQFTKRIELLEKKLSFLTNQSFTNEFTECGRKLLEFLVRKEMFDMENLLFNNKTLYFLERNNFLDVPIKSKIAVGKLVIISTDFFGKQINKLFYNLANQIDHFAQRFICDSFGLEDLIKLINSHSSRIDDILIDFRYLTIIYITYKSSVVQDKLIKLNKSVDEFRMLSHSPEIFVKDFFTDLRKEITATFNELQLDKAEILAQGIKEVTDSERQIKHINISEVTFKNIELIQFLIEILNTEKLSEILIEETRELIGRVLREKQLEIKDSLLQKLDANSLGAKLLRSKNNESKEKFTSCINDLFKQINDKIQLEEEIKNKKIEMLIKKSENDLQELNSTIMSGKCMMQLMELCNFPLGQKWKLLYRATSDGFLAENFHAKCDGFRNTLTIIKSKNENIFGGYTEADWSGNLVYKHDMNAFIFSLINKYSEPLLIKCSSPQHAIYCSNTFGPVFGFSPCDIAIEHNANVKKSYSNLGCSYTHPKYAAGSYDALTFLAGTRFFQAVDIEVYSKI